MGNIIKLLVGIVKLLDMLHQENKAIMTFLGSTEKDLIQWDCAFKEAENECLSRVDRYDT